MLECSNVCVNCPPRKYTDEAPTAELTLAEFIAVIKKVKPFTW
jgi:hypothetical protein